MLLSKSRQIIEFNVIKVFCELQSIRTPCIRYLQHQGGFDIQVARASREEAIANMQSFKAGLANALTSREESLRAGLFACVNRIHAPVFRGKSCTVLILSSIMCLGLKWH